MDHKAASFQSGSSQRSSCARLALKIFANLRVALKAFAGPRLALAALALASLALAGCDKCGDPIKFNAPSIPKSCYGVSQNK